MLSHLFVTDSFVCVEPCIVFSQRRTQIKCADSDTRILNSREVPRCCAIRCLFSRVFSAVDVGMLRVPHPSINPMVIVGQTLCSLFQARFASCQMVLDSILLHSVIICSSVSESAPHETHFDLCSYKGMFLQKSPIL